MNPVSALYFGASFGSSVEPEGRIIIPLFLSLGIFWYNMEGHWNYRPVQTKKFGLGYFVHQFRNSKALRASTGTFTIASAGFYYLFKKNGLFLN